MSNIFQYFNIFLIGVKNFWRKIMRIYLRQKTCLTPKSFFYTKKLFLGQKAFYATFPKKNVFDVKKFWRKNVLA